MSDKEWSTYPSSHYCYDFQYFPGQAKLPKMKYIRSNVAGDSLLKSTFRQLSFVHARSVEQ